MPLREKTWGERVRFLVASHWYVSTPTELMAALLTAPEEQGSAVLLTGVTSHHLFFLLIPKGKNGLTYA